MRVGQPKEITSESVDGGVLSSIDLSGVLKNAKDIPPENISILAGILSPATDQHLLQELGRISEQAATDDNAFHVIIAASDSSRPAVREFAHKQAIRLLELAGKDNIERLHYAYENGSVELQLAVIKQYAKTDSSRERCNYSIMGLSGSAKSPEVVAAAFGAAEDRISLLQKRALKDSNAYDFLLFVAEHCEAGSGYAPEVRQAGANAIVKTIEALEPKDALNPKALEILSKAIYKDYHWELRNSIPNAARESALRMLDYLRSRVVDDPKSRRAAVEISTFSCNETKRAAIEVLITVAEKPEVLDRFLEILNNQYERDPVVRQLSNQAVLDGIPSLGRRAPKDAAALSMLVQICERGMSAASASAVQALAPQARSGNPTAFEAISQRLLHTGSDVVAEAAVKAFAPIVLRESKKLEPNYDAYHAIHKYLRCDGMERACPAAIKAILPLALAGDEYVLREMLDCRRFANNLPKPIAVARAEAYRILAAKFPKALDILCADAEDPKSNIRYRFYQKGAAVESLGKLLPKDLPLNRKLSEQEERAIGAVICAMGSEYRDSHEPATAIIARHIRHPQVAELVRRWNTEQTSLDGRRDV